MNRARKKARSWRRWLGPGVGATLLGAAVVTERRKPTGTRTLEGRIAGRIPYDFRRPTLVRARQRMWNPADRRILVPTVFGVGWTVNLGRLLERRVAELPEPSGPDIGSVGSLPDTTGIGAPHSDS